MNALLTVSSFLFPLITFPYVSRILLPEGIGKVAMGTSVIAYFALLARLGIPLYGIRACAGVRDDREKLSQTVQELFLMNLFMAAVSYILLFITVFSVPRFREEHTLYLIMSVTILLEALGVEWLYKALEEYTYITCRSIFFKVVALAATFLFIHTQQDYIRYGAITILAVSASNLLNFYNLRKYISFKPQRPYRFTPHVKPVLYFFATTCAIIIYTQLNTVILGFLKTNADVGYYDSAMKIKNILVSIVTALGAVLLPRASYYVKQGLMEEFSRICTKAIQFVYFLALPLTVYFILFAEQGIYFLSGNNFAGAILPLQIVMPTLFLIGLTNIIGLQILIPLGKERDVFYSVTGGGIVDLIACFLLIPPYGTVGAAVSNLVAELTVLVMQYYYARKCKDLFDIHKALQQVQYKKIIPALLVSAGVVYPCTFLAWDNIAVLLFSGILFFSLYGAILGLLKESFFVELWQLLKRKLKR